MSTKSVLDLFGPKVTYDPMTFGDTRKRFLDGYEQAIKALDAGSFKDTQRRGWLTIMQGDEPTEWKFLIRAGYGDNNQWVPHSDPRVRKDRWITASTAQEARTQLDALLSLAEEGFWDEGLKSIFNRNQRMVEARKPQLDDYRAKSLEANTLVKYGMVANDNGTGNDNAYPEKNIVDEQMSAPGAAGE